MQIEYEKWIRDSVLVKNYQLMNAANQEFLTDPASDSLAAAIDAYDDQIARPRAAVQQRKAAIAKIKGAFAGADHLLRQRLDLLVSLLATDYPEFAVDYRNTRMIVDSGGGKSVRRKHITV